MQLRDIGLVLAIAGVCLVPLLVWICRLQKDAERRRPKVSIVEGLFALHLEGTRKEIRIRDIREIRHSWVAAVFYAGNWEFETTSGDVLVVDALAVDLAPALQELESFLPGFSVVKVKQAVSDGDIHGESICAWRAA